jgi:hypothetical protein
VETKRRPREAERRQPPPPQPAADGVAVIAAGEPLLAGDSEAMVEKILGGLGRRVVDERALSGIGGFPDDDSGRPIPELLRALRPHARYLVVIHARYLGSRELKYMGRWDTAHQARLRVTAYDLASGQPLGSGFDERIEYTHQSLADVLSKELGPAARRLGMGLE